MLERKTSLRLQSTNSIYGTMEIKPIPEFRPDNHPSERTDKQRISSGSMTEKDKHNGGIVQLRWKSKLLSPQQHTHPRSAELTPAGQVVERSGVSWLWGNSWLSPNYPTGDSAKASKGGNMASSSMTRDFGGLEGCSSHWGLIRPS